MPEPVPFPRPLAPQEPPEHAHPEDELAPERSELDPATEALTEHPTESLVEQFERARREQETAGRTMIDPTPESLVEPIDTVDASTWSTWSTRCSGPPAARSPSSPSPRRSPSTARRGWCR